MPILCREKLGRYFWEGKFVVLALFDVRSGLLLLKCLSVDKENVTVGT